MGVASHTRFVPHRHRLQRPLGNEFHCAHVKPRIHGSIAGVWAPTSYGDDAEDSVVSRGSSVSRPTSRFGNRASTGLPPNRRSREKSG